MLKSIIICRENSKASLSYMKMKPCIVSMMFPELDIVPILKKCNRNNGKNCTQNN